MSKSLSIVPAEIAVRSAAPVALEILTPQQVADRLQLPVSWVYEQTRNRASARNGDPLPHMKLGRYLRFNWDAVVAWLNRQCKTAA